MIVNGNDQRLAEQILDESSQVYRYADDTDAWFRISGDHWERCPKSPCRTIVAVVAGKLPKPKDTNWDGATAPLPGDPDEQDKKLYMRLHNSRTASPIASTMEAVAPTRRDRVREADMDADPYVFWAGGNPWNLRTGTPGNIMTPHLLTAGYAPVEGPTPLWDALNEAQFPDPERREYALNVFASILPGGSSKLLPNFKTDGNLGKTTRLMLLVDLLGSYAAQLPVQLLGNYSGHDESYLRLKGKRLVWLDETPPSGKVAAEKLKNLSGGGQLTGRAINGRAPVTFSQQHTLFLAGNDDLPLTDDNVQRRVRYLSIEEKQRGAVGEVSRKIWDHGALSAEWKREAPAVLYQLMTRAKAVLADRSLTNMPLSELEVFADAIIDQDTVGQFVRDCCEAKGETPGGQLYEAYVSWCQRNAVRVPATNTAFGRRLNDMRHQARKTGGIMVRPLSVRPVVQSQW